MRETVRSVPVSVSLPMFFLCGSRKATVEPLKIIGRSEGTKERKYSGDQKKLLIRKPLEHKYTLNSEPKALTGDKSEGIKSRGAAEAFIRGFSPVKAEGEEFNVLILSYTRELSRPFKENKG